MRINNKQQCNQEGKYGDIYKSYKLTDAQMTYETCIN